MVLKALVVTQWVFVVALGTTFLNHLIFTDHQLYFARYILEDSDMFGYIMKKYMHLCMVLHFVNVALSVLNVSYSPLALYLLKELRVCQRP